MRHDAPHETSGSSLLPIIAPVPSARAGRRERRAAPRLAVELECEERTPGQRYIRYTHDVSPFGVATRAGVNAPLGQAIQLTLHLPDGGAPLSLRARVINHHATSGGVRMRFTNPSREAVQRISRFVAARARGPFGLALPSA